MWAPVRLCLLVLRLGQEGRLRATDMGSDWSVHTYLELEAKQAEAQ